MNVLTELSRKHMVKCSEDGKFRWNVLMTEKRCQLRQELVGRNIERTKQVIRIIRTYEHYLCYPLTE